MFRRFWKSYAGSNPAAAPGQRDAAGSRIGVLTVPHPAISRRQVLAGLLASPILIPAVKHFLPPVGGWPVGFSTANMSYLARYTHETHALGFAITDGVALTNAAHPMSAAAFRVALLPGLNEIWAAEYDKHGDEFTAIYGEEPPSLLNSDSIEEIEIELQPAADAFGRISLLPEKERVATAQPLGEFESDRERESRLFLPQVFGFRKG